MLAHAKQADGLYDGGPYKDRVVLCSLFFLGMLVNLKPFSDAKPQAFSVALGDVPRLGQTSLTVRVHARKRGVRICHCVKLNALLVQWPRRFEPSDVSCPMADNYP